MICKTAIGAVAANLMRTTAIPSIVAVQRQDLGILLGPALDNRTSVIEQQLAFVTGLPTTTRAGVNTQIQGIVLGPVTHRSVSQISQELGISIGLPTVTRAGVNNQTLGVIITP